MVVNSTSADPARSAPRQRMIKIFQKLDLTMEMKLVAGVCKEWKALASEAEAGCFVLHVRLLAALFHNLLHGFQVIFHFLGPDHGDVPFPAFKGNRGDGVDPIASLFPNEHLHVH